MTKQIDTLVDDIKELMINGKDCDPEQVSRFGQRLAETVARRLAEERRDVSRGSLRMSNLGRPDRQLYYEVTGKAGDREKLDASALLKFLFGDILELLLLFLAEQAGHTVTNEQTEVVVDGVVGHKDADIDGVVVDCKSASTISFKKFKTGELVDDDPFGYMEQLAAYCDPTKQDGAFLAIDKQLGHIALLKVPYEELETYNIKERITHIKGVLEKDEEPPRCYEPVPEGKSGNMRLDVGCSYCPFKFHCWSDTNNGVGLRTFLYARGPVHFTHIEKEPDVYEITF